MQLSNKVKNDQVKMSYSSTIMYAQSGFTLVELMVSLALGLLIVAAAFQIFYISQRTATTQSSASGVQDSAVFGLRNIEHDIRLANLNADSHEMNYKTKNGGIIFSDQNVAAPLSDSTKYANYYTRQAANDSYYTVNADQLTIQFETPEDMFDCEGNAVPAGTRLIQRYFLQSHGSAAKPNFSLACDAAIIDPTDPTKTNFGSRGGAVTIIPNVEQFRVLLMTDSGFKDINSYVAAAGTGTGEPIYGVKLGLVLAGATPTIQAQNSDSGIKLLDTNITVKSGLTKVNTVRRVYEPTILIRNARL